MERIKHDHNVENHGRSRNLDGVVDTGFSDKLSFDEQFEGRKRAFQRNLWGEGTPRRGNSMKALRWQQVCPKWENSGKPAYGLSRSCVPLVYGFLEEGLPLPSFAQRHRCSPGRSKILVRGRMTGDAVGQGQPWRHWKSNTPEVRHPGFWFGCHTSWWSSLEPVPAFLSTSKPSVQNKDPELDVSSCPFPYTLRNSVNLLLKHNLNWMP